MTNKLRIVMKDERLPSLDGLRAIAITGVILRHCSETAGFSKQSLLVAAARTGTFGVDIFFVLSGFLITTLLLREEARSGSLNLSTFYWRRTIRILPPALFYLTVMLLLGCFGLTTVSALEWFKAALFLKDYAVTGSWETGHFWSLSVEEQFYLMWPVILVLLPRRSRVSLAITGILVAPLWRYVNMKLNWISNPFRFDVHYDALLVGSLLAFLRADPRWLKCLRNGTLQSWLTPTALTVAFVVLHAAVISALIFNLEETVLIIGVALVISYVVDCPSCLLGNLCNWRISVWLGKLSYSLYLWQQVFCVRHDGSPDLTSSLPIQHFPLNILASLGMALFSYLAIEIPANNLKRRFTRRLEAVGSNLVIPALVPTP